MDRERSFYGHVLTGEPGGRKCRRKSKRYLVLAIAVTIMLISSATVIITMDGGQESPARTSSQNILPVGLLYQMRDNPTMPCVWCAAFMPWHPNAATAFNCTQWGGNGSLNPLPNPYGDGIYGTSDDCAHCMVYCGPASIAMVATYWGMPAPMNQQDDIYEASELRFGIPANGMIEQHGRGMTDGSGGSPLEMQTGFMFAMAGLSYIQHNQSDATNLTATQLEQYIIRGHPVIWIDHKGWPVNMDPIFPTAGKSDQGHVRVIAGYDDNNTVGDATDDSCLIYDPWPEYTDKGYLPLRFPNATLGPGGTFDPYWLPVRDLNLTTDPADIYLVDTMPDIPEFTTLILPIMGMALLAVIAMRRRRTPDT